MFFTAVRTENNNMRFQLNIIIYVFYTIILFNYVFCSSTADDATFMLCNYLTT